MLVVGLTGGIGSGKSTVAELLAERGATVVDCDGLGRAVIAPGGRAERAVLDAFESVAGPDGHVDRARLAAAVFGQPDQLARLTAISHPAINDEIAAVLDAAPAEAIVVLDMAVLVESRLGRLPDGRGYSRVVVVEAPEELRVQRAVARGMAEADVRARMAAQATDDERRAVADAVVRNDRGLDELRVEVDALWRRLLEWVQAAT